MASDLIKTKNIFLGQSIEDAWTEYRKSLKKKNYINWDFVVLTASNEAQAEVYRLQIENRKKSGRLNEKIQYLVVPDPDGKRVGSGGATFNVMREITALGVKDFTEKRILVIHSGGDSKRVPQYSACGKLFSPVPRLLPDASVSTLFDEIIISMAGIPARMQGGMMVLSGDVLMLFNPLQVDLQFGDAVAVSIKENVATGKNHGVFLRGEDGCVKRFLHKMSEENLRNLGAVNERDLVDIDTGAIMLSGRVLNSLYELVEGETWQDFINEKSRISFYGDFLYPLAKDSTAEDFMKEKPEGEMCEELLECRRKIWEKLCGYTLKMINLSPAEFVHFGTTHELLALVTENIGDYSCMGWEKHVLSNAESDDYASNNAVIDEQAQIGVGSYIENSVIGKNVNIGRNCVISCAAIENVLIPDNTALHVLKMANGRFVARIYGVNDDPKKALLFGKQINAEPELPLWEKRIYKPFDDMESAVKDSLNAVSRLLEGKVLEDADERLSLKISFNEADVRDAVLKSEQISYEARVGLFLKALKNRTYLTEAALVFGDVIPDECIKLLEERAYNENSDIKLRIFYYLSKLSNVDSERHEMQAFASLRDDIRKVSPISEQRISFIKDECKVLLPVRVNWGGGWSDTPPYCNENGGTVINAAISLNGQLPIESCVKRLAEPKVVFESKDAESYGEFNDIKKLQNYGDPFDPFALHKAALIACGIIPETGGNLEEICSKMGGGLYLSTRVYGIPRGSGLGTSSILAEACVCAVSDVFGWELSDSEKIQKVLCMEQLMSTGGGWQDQAGGLLSGIKFLKTKPGLKQNVICENVSLEENVLDELQERFVIIYTGQRRLARNLLREVMGKYIRGEKLTSEILHKIQRIAVLMKFELEKGNIDGFAELMNEHWELSKQLDSGCSNTCIEQIFESCADLIAGRMICGAGGGGFLQAVLKKDCSKEMLSERLRSVFNESGIDVWECSFV